jgi:hypothetical protein
MIDLIYVSYVNFMMDGRLMSSAAIPGWETELVFSERDSGEFCMLIGDR